MGEAKRRKQRDASYGQGYDISTPRSLARHVGKLFLEADELWAKNLAAYCDFERADKTLTDWMQQQMSCFKAQDRSIVATAFITHYLKAGKGYIKHLSEQYPQDLEEHGSGWLLMFQAVAKASRPWLPEVILQELEPVFELESDSFDDINQDVELISGSEPQSLLLLEGSNRES